MVYNPNIPTAPQKLSVSQPLILANFGQLDTSFGIDHYKFSDATANNGFHNSVTTPEYSTSTDPVTGANPIFYGLENTVNLGLLQYSRGPNNAVPTPVTKIQSSSTPITILSGNTINLLDFTGITYALGSVNFGGYISNFTRTISTQYFFFFNNGVFTGSQLQNTSSMGVTATGITFLSSGNILQLNFTLIGGTSVTLGNWTLDLQRIII